MHVNSGSSVKITILSAILLALIAQPMMAQSQNISGTVADASGGLIPGAAVKITDAAKGGVAREVTTDDSGRFQAINIQPGRYLISVEKSGFKADLAVTLDVNSKMDVGQIKLEVGNVSEAVSVNAATSPLVRATPWKKPSWWTVRRSRSCP